MRDFSEFARDTPATKVRRLQRAVSSVVEHLVYTERVGGSKPSPPIFDDRERACVCLKEDSSDPVTRFQSMMLLI